MPDTIIEIPLNTGQSLSQHPFFSGTAFQTDRTSNIWQDDRGRIRRRASIHKVGDTGIFGSFTGIFNYRFAARSSSGSSSQLVAFQDPLNETAAPGQSAAVFDLSEGEFGFPATIADVGTRIHLRTATHAERPQGIDFIPFESCVLRDNAGANLTSGDLVTGNQQILVDNLDYSTPGGDVIIRSIGVDPSVPSTSGWRLTGSTSGANVRFSAISVQPLHKAIWTADTIANWTPFAHPDFMQFGRYLFILEDSHRYPLRIWTGGSNAASTVPQAPRGSFLSVHQNRIWIAGLQRDPTEIIGCGRDILGFPNVYDWNTSNLREIGAVSLRVSADDQDIVTGISRTFLGDMYVFKRKSLHRIVGNVFNDLNFQGALPFQIQTLSRTLGCGSHRSIQQVGNDLFWMSEKGVHSLQATNQFGDIEQAYLSFPIADLFEKLNKRNLQVSQSVFMPRLGLYLLGVPECDCAFMSKLLVYSVATKRWQVWDIGKFTSIGLGPTRGGETESVWVSIVTNDDPDAPESSFCVLNFEDETDWDQEFVDGAVRLGSNTGIATVLEPGDLFTDNADIRYGVKSIDRMQFYIASPGNFTSTIKYAWDAADEDQVTLDLNPNKDKCFGTRFALGSNEKGNALGSRDDTSVTSVRLTGHGHTCRFRIEDSNVGRLPYLHADAAVSGHGADWSPTTRDK
jgi:hypothetical protein